MDFREIEELLAEAEAQAREVEGAHARGDRDGELFALAMTEALLGLISARADRLKTSVMEAKHEVVRDGYLMEDRSRRIAVGILQALRRAPDGRISESVRVFSVGFEDGRARRVARTTEDVSYVAGHHLGLSTLEN